MRLYLDSCCLNRPFDDQNQLRVRLEAEAIPHAATTETFSFNRVGNAPRVLERGQRLTRGPLATRLNDFWPA